MKTIYCYGDSNTYGYDPRGILEDRYEEDVRWCDRLEKALACPVINGGLNGRCVPGSDREYQCLRSSLEGSQILMILLGTNDLLMGADPGSIAGAMEELIQRLQEDFPALSILLLSPPAFRLPGFRCEDPAQELARGYERIAVQYGISFLRLGSLPLAYDGVHLSEEGHRQLSSLLSGFLRLEGLL